MSPAANICHSDLFQLLINQDARRHILVRLEAADTVNTVILILLGIEITIECASRLGSSVDRATPS